MTNEIAVGSLYDCERTTPREIFEFPSLPDCNHQMNSSMKVTTQEVQVYRYSPISTKFNAAFCELEKEARTCNAKNVFRPGFRGSIHEKIAVSPEQCNQAWLNKKVKVAEQETLHLYEVNEAHWRNKGIMVHTIVYLLLYQLP